MTEPTSLLAHLQDFSTLSAFNRWLDIQVIAAGEGVVELRLKWRDELGQYDGFLHAGVIGSLIDTAAGFAAVTQIGPALVSHFSVNMMRPAVGDFFIARGEVIRAGKKQVFARAEIFALSAAEKKLVATGDVIVVPVTEE